jgi:hypothetical protein
MLSASTDTLVSLIKLMTKAEKRHFKLFSGRVSSTIESAKFMKLYDFIEKSTNYTDKQALVHIKDIKKEQLSNIKSHLQRQVLASLNLQYAHHFPTAEVRELLDNAHIFYQKGLYSAALKSLEKAREKAEQLNANLLLLEIVEFEKKIESQDISSNHVNKIELLMNRSEEAQKIVNQSVELTNLALQLDAKLAKLGMVRNIEDYKTIQGFFKQNLPEHKLEELSFNEKITLYNSFVWFNHIIQDFLMCYRYAQKWVDTFEEYPKMKEIDIEMYLKGMHNLLLSLFHIRYYSKYNEVMTKLEVLDVSKFNSRNIVLLKEMYLCTAVINKHYLEGSFEEGLKIIPRVESFISDAVQRFDSQKILILYYKLACMCFGAGKNRETIRYLNKIIQSKDQDFAEDIQCFSRILNLIAHFELGNDDLVEYQIKSVYRFLIKMNDLQGVQREILNFLRNIPRFTSQSAHEAFQDLLNKLIELSQNKFEKRPFLYLDIISWLEAKINKTTVQEIAQSKFMDEQKTGLVNYFPVKKS